MKTVTLTVHGKEVLWTEGVAMWYVGKHDGAWLCCKVWKNAGQVQQAEHFSLQDYIDLMGGN
jgi:hypothetical protein